MSYAGRIIKDVAEFPRTKSGRRQARDFIAKYPENEAQHLDEDGRIRVVIYEPKGFVFETMRG